ncbi:MAG: hypothetical protein KDD66_06720 [Bdellovibrionales bacterium]|nr:hypothetical protein [Bdellovibrionales bacterium]
MDLYRYFHPHHNPRLRSKPVRQLELAELEQAASEMHKAVRRAQIRTTNAPAGPIRAEHFEEMLIALNYLLETLGTLNDAHPGDDTSEMYELLAERAEAPGWESWTQLLRQRLELLKSSAPQPEVPPRRASNG